MGEPDDEKERVQRSRNDDHEAFAELVRNYQRMVHSLCFRMTGSLAEAEDLAQETFIQAFQSMTEFRGESAFSSWLYRVAMNKCLNWRKREERRRRIQSDWEPPEKTNPRVNEISGEELQEALLKLHPKQRAAVVLTICEGQSHAEAARTLGCSETTVSWRVFAAKRKLRRWLGKIHD